MNRFQLPSAGIGADVCTELFHLFTEFRLILAILALFRDRIFGHVYTLKLLDLSFSVNRPETKSLGGYA